MTQSGHTGPLLWEGEPLSLAKAPGHGTPRSSAPETTWRKIPAMMERIGITRLANVTSLDKTGVPTVMAMRPTGKILSVAFGKGMNLLQASLSAAMESMERRQAEVVRRPLLRASHAELAARGPVIPLERLILPKHSPFHEQLPVAWTMGFDLVQQQQLPTPWEQVSLTPQEHGGGLACFFGGSNGLAAGNHLLEAVCQALLEVIERDAVTCHFEAARAVGAPMLLDRVDHHGADLQPLCKALEMLEKSRMGVAVYDCTADTATPTYGAVVWDREALHQGLAMGFGTSLTPQVAMLRAVTEAALGRAETISGMRENYPPFDYWTHHLTDHAAMREALDEQPMTVPVDRHPDAATPSFEGDVHLLLEKLRAVGLDNVLAFDISEPGLELHVVRLVVPGLEGYYEFPYSQPHARALQYAAARASEARRA